LCKLSILYGWEPLAERAGVGDLLLGRDGALAGVGDLLLGLDGDLAGVGDLLRASD